MHLQCSADGCAPFRGVGRLCVERCHLFWFFRICACVCVCVRVCLFVSPGALTSRPLSPVTSYHHHDLPCRLACAPPYIKSGSAYHKRCVLFLKCVLRNELRWVDQHQQKVHIYSAGGSSNVSIETVKEMMAYKDNGRKKKQIRGERDASLPLHNVQYSNNTPQTTDYTRTDREMDTTATAIFSQLTVK